MPNSTQTLVAVETTWYIAHNNGEIIHYGVVFEGSQVTTCQPEFETFDNESVWNARKAELGITPEMEG
jgi:hypothetical protein